MEWVRPRGEKPSQRHLFTSFRALKEAFLNVPSVPAQNPRSNQVPATTQLSSSSVSEQRTTTQNNVNQSNTPQSPRVQEEDRRGTAQEVQEPGYGSHPLQNEQTEDVHEQDGETTALQGSIVSSDSPPPGNRGIAGPSTEVGRILETARAVVPATRDRPLSNRFHEIKIGRSKAYISETLHAEQKHQEIWDHRIRKKLEVELWEVMQSSKDSFASMSIGFMMASAGTDDRSFQPTVIISCSSESLRHKQDQRVKSLKWLSSYGYRCLIFVSPILTLANDSGNLPIEEFEVEARIDEGWTTVCGIPIQAHPAESRSAFTVKSTMGGLINDQGRMYGLTAGHIFRPDPKAAVHGEGHGPLDVDIALQSPPDSAADSPFVVFDSDASTTKEDTNAEEDSGILTPVRSVSGVGRDAPEDIRGDQGLFSHARLGTVIFRSAFNPLPDNASFGEGSSLPESSDWALVDFQNRDCWLPNLYHESPGNPTNTQPIREVRAIQAKNLDVIPSHGPVSVIAGFTGIVRGHLMESSFSFVVGNTLYHVKQVVLEKKLGPGDSGAWVIQDGIVCGHIIAGQERLPWAYLIPISQTFKDLIRVFNTYDVSIPSSIDITHAKDATFSEDHYKLETFWSLHSEDRGDPPLEPVLEVEGRTRESHGGLEISTRQDDDNSRSEPPLLPQDEIASVSTRPGSHANQVDQPRDGNGTPQPLQEDIGDPRPNTPPPPYRYEVRRRPVRTNSSAAGAQALPQAPRHSGVLGRTNIRFLTGVRRFVPVLAYHHILMLMVAIEITMISLILAGCSSSNGAIPNIYLMSLVYHASTPVNSSSQLNPTLLTQIANITSNANLEIRAGYFGLCVRPLQQEWDCSASSSSVASRVTAEQDPLNLIWTANNFKSDVILSAFLFVAIILSAITLFLLSTFPGWHEEIDENGSDREVKPFPSRQTSLLAASCQGFASGFTLISATWQHVATVGASSGIQALANGAVSTTVGTTAMALGWTAVALGTVVFVGLVVMILSIDLLDRLGEDL